MFRAPAPSAGVGALAGAFPGCTALMDRIAAERGSDHHEHALTRVHTRAACDVAVWIHEGRVRGRGDIDELLDAYRLEQFTGDAGRAPEQLRVRRPHQETEHR